MPRRSDGYNTFEFFDHFVYSTDNYNKWEVLTGNNSYSQTIDGTNNALLACLARKNANECCVIL